MSKTKIGLSALDMSQKDSSRERVVRQIRFDLAGDFAFVKIQDRLIEIFDCSPFGLALLSGDPLGLLEKETEIELFYKKISINVVRIKKIRHESVANGMFKIACEVVGEPIDMEKIKAVQKANLVISQHLADSQASVFLPEQFKKIVYEMQDWLLALKSNVNTIETNQDFNRASDINIYENTVANIIGNYIVKTFEPVYAELEKSLTGINKEQLLYAFEFFRIKMKELLQEAPFHNRAFNKPLGYAGDFQMMNQIYTNEGLGKTLFSKCLHLYFISAPESRAVRNRADYLCGQILESLKRKRDKIKILSVASGPAMEIQKVIKNHSNLVDKIEVHLLDQDLESLQYAQRMIKNLERETNTQIELKLLNQSIKRVIAGGLQHKDYDLIYSAGLFDYFSDPVAQVAGQRLFEALADKGKLIIGNFSTSSPGKITMDIALDWHLIYRSMDELTHLFSHTADNFKIEHEPEGINLFCHLDKV